MTFAIQTPPKTAASALAAGASNAQQFLAASFPPAGFAMAAASAAVPTFAVSFMTPADPADTPKSPAQIAYEAEQALLQPSSQKFADKTKEFHTVNHGLETTSTGLGHKLNEIDAAQKKLAELEAIKTPSAEQKEAITATKQQLAQLVAAKDEIITANRPAAGAARDTYDTAIREGLAKREQLKNELAGLEKINSALGQKFGGKEFPAELAKALQADLAGLNDDKKKQLLDAVKAGLDPAFMRTHARSLGIIKDNYAQGERATAAALAQVASIHPGATDASVQDILARTYTSLMNNRANLTTAGVTDTTVLNGVFGENLRNIGRVVAPPPPKGP